MPLSQDSVTVSAFAISPEKAGSPFSYHIIELLNQESEIVLKTPKFPTTKTLNFHCTKGNSCICYQLLSMAESTCSVLRFSLLLRNEEGLRTSSVNNLLLECPFSAQLYL